MTAHSTVIWWMMSLFAKNEIVDLMVARVCFGKLVKKQSLSQLSRRDYMRKIME